jgi:glycine hydroxymethyltransferase
MQAKTGLGVRSSLEEAADGKSALAVTDPEIFRAIQQEVVRQRDGIELIAAENYTSRAVLEAQACVMTNKYAEGYPGRRYYGGCEFVDVAENLARERVKKLFGAEHANVQPHSGTQTNMAVYAAVLKPGDTILSMSLDQGGHLSHGHKVNFSGKLYHIVSYGVHRDSETIDYDQVARLAEEHRPQMIVAGASAYPRFIDYKRFGEIARSVGAYLTADIAHVAGMIAVGLHPNPIPHADFVTSTTHKTLRGPRGGFILCKEEHARALDRAVFPGIQGGPFMHTIAAKAVCFAEAMTPEFKAYQQQLLDNAKALGDELVKLGFRLVSGGTDNHLMLVDLRPAGVTGRQAEVALEDVHITVNKNMIPYDPEKPTVTSGVRLGSPAVTSRGFREAEMRQVARWIADVLHNLDDQAVRNRVREEVIDLCRQFPLPGVDV